MPSLSINVVDLSSNLDQLTMPPLHTLDNGAGALDLLSFPADAGMDALADAAHAVSDLAGAALPGLVMVAAFMRMVKWAFNSTS